MGGTKPKDLIAAYIVGAEVCARLAGACPGLSSDAGWHGAGVFGTVAAACAFARLTGQSREVIADILGISVSMASGVGVNFGTMTKPLHAGLAARNGLMSVELGGRGFTGSAMAVEGRNGFFQSFARGLEINVGVFEDLGQRYYLDDPGNKIKPYACGGVLHSTIDAAVAIHDVEKLPADAIDRIVIGVTSHAKNRAIDAYPWSEDSSRFSPRYIISSALLYGAPQVSTFTEHAIADEVVARLAERCEVVVDTALDCLTEGAVSPGRVSVILRDGTQHERIVLAPSGTRATPMSRERLLEKFMACATLAVSEERAVGLGQFLAEFGDKASLDELWELLGFCGD